MTIWNSGKHGTFGHCFDRLFAGEALDEAKHLPPVATGAALRRIANSHANPFSTAGCEITSVQVDGCVLWHVGVGDIDPKICLYMMDKSALVGASPPPKQLAQDVSAEVHAVAPVVTSSAASIDIGGPVLRRRFLWSLTLIVAPGETDYAVLNPTTVDRIVNVSRLFESVKLVGCSAVVSVSAGSDVVAGIAFGKQGFGPPDLGSLKARPHNMLCYGKNDGNTRHFWDLPEKHNFGVEYKATNPGNKVGHLAIKLAGPSQASVDVDGYFDIEFAGEGINEPVRLKPHQYSDKSAVRKAAAGGGRVPSNIKSCIQDAEDVPTDEDDDSD